MISDGSGTADGSSPDRGHLVFEVLDEETAQVLRDLGARQLGVEDLRKHYSASTKGTRENLEANNREELPTKGLCESLEKHLQALQEQSEQAEGRILQAMNDQKASHSREVSQLLRQFTSDFLANLTQQMRSGKSPKKMGSEDMQESEKPESTAVVTPEVAMPPECMEDVPEAELPGAIFAHEAENSPILQPGAGKKFSQVLPTPEERCKPGCKRSVLGSCYGNPLTKQLKSDDLFEVGPTVTSKARQDSMTPEEKRNAFKWTRNISHSLSSTSVKNVVNGLQKFLESSLFDRLVATVIAVNVLVIGAETNWRIQNLSGEGLWGDVWLAFHYIFSFIYFCELMLRLLVERMLFFSRKNADLRWNLFDLMLVLASTIDILADLTLQAWSPGGNSLSTVRLLRILRLLRIMRILRVMRFLKDLRAMVHGIIMSVRSLVWALILLILIMYVFAVLIMQILVEELSGADVSSNNEASTYFPNVLRGIYTLFSCICGGIDWGDVAEPLISIHPLLGLFFASYISFAVFCVLNIVTGVFVESSRTMSNRDDQFLAVLEHRNSWLRDVDECFKRIDTSCNGEIALDEFVAYATSVKGNLDLNSIGLELDPQGAEDFFNLLDLEGGGTITMDEFLQGCTEMKGGARGLDLFRFRSEMKDLGSVIKHTYSLISSGLRVRQKSQADASAANDALVVAEVLKSLEACAEEGLEACAEEDIQPLMVAPPPGPETQPQTDAMRHESTDDPDGTYNALLDDLNAP
eukprot:TRINITY_DN11796_c0_g2_i1.p1 TRINITY_DN11796_c0_g2~~TRINITY_DN11796_c0_g2_i1.p1  ORF type:complete len:751 (-),score=212.70 TRINITY_DN11796_c0_g2_i1:111-2363(-)